MMHNFFKDMPKGLSEKGNYRVYTGMYFIYIKNKEYSSRTYTSKLMAYVAVRLMALIRDIKTLGSECGVVWGIEEV